MKETIKPRLRLRMKLYERYGSGRQYRAAHDFEIRDDVLSAILVGRKTPSEEIIKMIEKKLQCCRQEIDL